LFVDQVAVTPLPFVISLTVTLVITWAALSAHAWRAARVNPATVLRYE